MDENFLRTSGRLFAHDSRWLGRSGTRPHRASVVMCTLVPSWFSPSLPRPFIVGIASSPFIHRSLFCPPSPSFAQPVGPSSWSAEGLSVRALDHLHPHSLFLAVSPPSELKKDVALPPLSPGTLRLLDRAEIDVEINGTSLSNYCDHGSRKYPHPDCSPHLLRDPPHPRG